MVERFSDLSLRLRGRAELWELPREELVLSHQIGEGACGTVFLARWRGLECAAKVLPAIPKFPKYSNKNKNKPLPSKTPPPKNQ